MGVATGYLVHHGDLHVETICQGARPSLLKHDVTITISAIEYVDEKGLERSS